MAHTIDLSRSLLFVPGNRPERFEQAARSGADAVILDLEDSVPVGDKAAARAAIVAAWPQLQRLGVPVIVRINAQGSAAWSDDLTAIRELPGLRAVMVPKAESVESLDCVRAAVAGARLLPMIETATGLDRVNTLAATPGVLRLVVGHIDFLVDLGMGCDEQESELSALRFAIAMATRLHGLAPAIDGVTVQTGDDRRLREDTLRGRRFGFGGKLCIHARQVAVVHEALAPSVEELDWARRVIAADAASGGAAVKLDGRMVDVPIVLLARQTLARALIPLAL